jgi:hypothetical protein
MKFNTLYNPHNIPKATLIKNFVIRKAEFNNIFEHIKYYTKRSNIKSIHYLIQGQRGAGKSTLLLRLKYECEKSDNLLPVMFNEEELSIIDVNSFFDRVFEIIEEFDIKFSSLEELFYHISSQNITLILLIDNFLEILESFTSTAEVKLFFEIIEKNKNIKIVGSIALKSDLYYKHKSFFEVYFEHIHLEGLHYMQSIEYLRYLSQYYDKKSVNKLINDNPKKIKILRDLTDGNPRIIAMLLDILANENSIMQDVEKLLDIVTEHYRHRTKELNNTQKMVLFEIAQNFNPISYDKLKSLKIEQNILDFELNKLQNNYIIQKIKTDTGDYFKIKERFFNIWFLMRYKKSSHNSIRWLIEFLDIWYDDDHLKAEIELHNKLLKKEKIDDEDIPQSIKFTESLNQVYIKRFGEDRLSDEHYILSIDFLIKKNSLSLFDGMLSMNKDDYYFKKALKEYESKKYKKSVEYIKNALEIDGENFIFWMMLASNYKNMGAKFELECIKSYKKAMQFFSSSDKKIPMLYTLYIEAIYGYILYYYKEDRKGKLDNINGINYYTDFLFTEFDTSHKNHYLESIKIFLMIKNIEIASKLLKNYLKIFGTNKKVESILNILYMQDFYEELLSIFDEFSYLQEQYNNLYYASLKAYDTDGQYGNYITIPDEIKLAVEHFIEHFSLHKKEILKMIRINIIEN